MSDAADLPAILIAEDRAIIAAKIRRDLQQAGYAVAAVAGTIAEAEAAAQRLPIRGAVLDVDLRGEPVYSVAAILLARRLPFLFLTGYGRAALPREWQGVPLLEKPFTGAALSAALRRAMSGVRPAPPPRTVTTPTIRRAWDHMRHNRDLLTEQRAWTELHRAARG